MVKPCVREPDDWELAVAADWGINPVCGFQLDIAQVAQSLKRMSVLLPNLTFR